MKRLIVLFGCVFLLLGGCQSPARPGSVEVVIEGGGEFPQSLAGRWKANEGGWEIVFEPDGRISSAVVSMGRVRMKPGQVTEVAMKKGGKGVFEPGKWLVHYAPATRELMVDISLKNFYVELGEDILEGKSTDVFVGAVSEDGKVWQVGWTSFPDYVAHTAEYPNFEMSEDPNYGISKTLIFEKVRPE